MNAPATTAPGSRADLEVVLADPVLLRAEFDGIIAASWSDPPDPPDPSPPGRWAPPVLAPEPRGPRPRPVAEPGPQRGGADVPDPREVGRQRSPPVQPVDTRRDSWSST